MVKSPAEQIKKEKIVVAGGKRKSAVAKAMISPKGEGKVTINKQDYNNLEKLDKLRIEEPLRIAEHILGERNFDIDVTVRGGGAQGQINASRLAIAKAILKFSKSKQLEKAFLEYDRNLLVADVRRKEAYKPGDSKARRKRQTSFR